jgi:FkbM family methyltransferase
MRPGWFDKGVLSLTGGLPDNWLGLRLAILLRRLITMRQPDGTFDVERWGLHVRLHPRDNGCEKNLLFTPQMYEPPERAAIEAEVLHAKREGHPFVFIDIGANVGLFSLFVAAHAGAQARILAIEPEPGNFARLKFNIAVNGALPITPLAVALDEEAGEVAVLLNQSDRGGTQVRAISEGEASEVVRVPCIPLLNLLREQGVIAIDALKIDVEGMEDKVLVPFFRDAPKTLWPRLIVIEDSRVMWKVDLFELFADYGYAVHSRSKQNVMLRREG